MPPKFRQIRRWLVEDGYYRVAKRGSHEQYAHPQKKGKVTIAGADNQEPALGTWKSIRRQAQWDSEGKYDV